MFCVQISQTKYAEWVRTSWVCQILVCSKHNTLPWCEISSWIWPCYVTCLVSGELVAHMAGDSRWRGLRVWTWVTDTVLWPTAGETRAYSVYSEQIWPKKESANVNSRVSWLSITTRFPGSVSANMLKRFQKWCVKLSSCKIEVVQIHVVQLSTKDSNNIPDLAIALASWISTELPFALPLDVQLLPCLHETHLPW